MTPYPVMCSSTWGWLMAGVLPEKSLHQGGGVDGDRGGGHILGLGPAAGGAGLDLVERGNAADHLAKRGVAMAIGVGGVEHGVVLHIDEELRGGRIRIAGARHGDGVALVLQAV